MGIYLYKGPLEILEGGSFARDSAIQTKEGSSTGGPERHIKEGSGEGHLFP